MNAMTIAPFAAPISHGYGYRAPSGAVRFRAAEGQAISIEQLAQLAPSVFADGAHESRSAKYAFIDSRPVIGGLIRQGFQIVEVTQGGSRIEGKRDFTKHALRLRHPDALKVKGVERLGIAPEVLMWNSHDGTSAYKFMAGSFKFACLNGCVFADDLFSEVRLPHKGNIGDDVIEGAFRVVRETERMVDVSSDMTGIELSTREQLAFATAARDLRWKPEEAPIQPSDLLRVKRHEDNGADLWRVFQRTQEHLIRGGDRYVRETRDQETGRLIKRERRTTGEVRNIDQNAGLNRALFTLANEMAKLKAA